ncbi:MAG TPA: hypothetical protein VGY91_13465, partial [Chthoniobacterales bacterium]|nr:hypothetical protein [Chthoniobacterales bacterium]
QLSEHIDLLITEVAHFPPAELFRFLSTKSIDRVVLTHLPKEWTGKEERLLKSAREALPAKRVTIASDKMRLEI